MQMSLHRLPHFLCGLFFYIFHVLKLIKGEAGDKSFEELKNIILYDQKFKDVEVELQNSKEIIEFEESEIIFKLKKMNTFLEWKWDTDCEG